MQTGRALIQQSIYTDALIGLKILPCSRGLALLGWSLQPDFHLRWAGLSILAEVASAAHLVKLVSFGSMGTISVLAGCGATHWAHLPQNFSSAVISSLGLLLICWGGKEKKRGKKKKRSQC